MRTVIILLCFLFSVSALGAIIGDHDNRMTYQEYANYKFPKSPQALNSYAAAGRINCPGFWASGTLVHRNNILVFAGHSAMEKNKKGRCVPRPDLGSCVFQSIRYDGSFGQPAKIDVASLKTSKNYRCSNNPERYNDLGDDWAVARLESAYPNVAPFELWDTTVYLSPPKKVTIFAARNDNFRNREPTICDGTAQYLWRIYHGPSAGVTYLLGTNCSSGGGGSGGAVTIIDGNSVRFIGLIVFTKQKDFDGLPFDNNNYSAGPYIQGELQEAILNE